MSTLILPRTGILSFMDDECRADLCNYGTQMMTAANDIVIQEGFPQTRLYVVLTGTYSVSTQAGGRPVQLEAVKEGDCFGEIAIFSPGLASATVKCSETGKLWFMEAAHIQQFLIDSPFAGCALLLGITTILSRRLKSANNVIKSSEIVPGFLSVRHRTRPDKVVMD